jgi:hypothetical protein
MTASAPRGTKSSFVRSLLRRWPSLVGLAAAVQALVSGVYLDGVAITICAACVCYLGAAALGRPWVGWAGIVGATAVVFLSELLGMPWWVGLGIIALVLVAVGLLLQSSRPEITAQTVALMGFGGLAVLGLFISPRLGLAAAGLALASHAVWDVIHYRRNIVVPRSLAEACILLDLPVGIAAIVLAITG